MNAIVTTNSETILTTPNALKMHFPLLLEQQKQIQNHRKTVENILNGTDSRLMLIMGPCSIHDTQSALEYADKLLKIQEKIKEKIFIVMRTYVEKPRTTVGWKGFLYDPKLDNSSDLETGLTLTRQLYLQIIEKGLPIASEILNPMATAYFDDLLSWAAIGARTSESQIHREISSYLPFAIGFKNGTDGSVQIALDAIQAASSPQQFFGLSQTGLPCMISSLGNKKPHLILRGSNLGTNYQKEAINALKKQIKTEMPALVIDCSHGNSQKNPLQQPVVLKQVIEEKQQTNVRGVMLETHLIDGCQKLSDLLTYGQSITDGCLGWEKTEQLILDIYTKL